MSQSELRAVDSDDFWMVTPPSPVLPLRIPLKKVAKGREPALNEDPPSTILPLHIPLIKVAKGKETAPKEEKHTVEREGEWELWDTRILSTKSAENGSSTTKKLDNGGKPASIRWSARRRSSPQPLPSNISQSSEMAPTTLNAPLKGLKISSRRRYKIISVINGIPVEMKKTELSFPEIWLKEIAGLKKWRCKKESPLRQCWTPTD